MNSMTPFVVLEWLFKIARVLLVIASAIFLIASLTIFFSEIPVPLSLVDLGYPSVESLHSIQYIIILVIAFVSLYLLFQIYSSAITIVQNVRYHQIFVSTNSDLLRKIARFLIINALINSTLLFDLIVESPFHYDDLINWNSIFIALILFSFATIIEKGQMKPEA